MKLNELNLKFGTPEVSRLGANDESMWYGPCLNRTTANTVIARGIWYTAYDIMHIRIIDSDINSFNRIRKKINRLISSRVFSHQLNPIIVGFSQTIDFESSPKSWIFMPNIVQYLGSWWLIGFISSSIMKYMCHFVTNTISFT